VISQLLIKPVTAGELRQPLRRLHIRVAVEHRQAERLPDLFQEKFSEIVVISRIQKMDPPTAHFPDFLPDHPRGFRGTIAFCTGEFPEIGALRLPLLWQPSAEGKFQRPYPCLHEPAPCQISFKASNARKRPSSPMEEVTRSALDL